MHCHNVCRIHDISNAGKDSDAVMLVRTVMQVRIVMLVRIVILVRIVW